MSEIKNLNPTCIWKNFYALTQVPRPSGHLEKVQNFLLDFAKQASRIPPITSSCASLPLQVWRTRKV